MVGVGRRCFGRVLISAFYTEVRLGVRLCAKRLAANFLRPIGGNLSGIWQG